MSRDSIVSPSDRILVTGAAGFVGIKVVEALLRRGFVNLRCLVRPSSNLGRLNEVLRRRPAEARVELVTGDLLCPDDCRRAAESVTVAYHLAAGIEKSFAGAFMNSALATRNLAEALLDQEALKRFVNISSFAVYSNFELDRGAVLDETCPLEDAPHERHDAYGFGKLKQEEVVRTYGREHGLPYVILRPGVVYGPGKPALSGRIGITAFGPLIHVGGSNLLPLTFVDNCAEAIVLGGLVPGVDGEVFNVVDDELLTSSQFLRAYRKARPLRTIWIPYALAYLFCTAWERYARRSQGQLPPVFNRRRCAAEWKAQRYSNQKLRGRLGWRPRVGPAEAMSAFTGQFRSPAR